MRAKRESQPFVPIAGRWATTEWLRFALKRSLPPFAIALVSAALRPQRMGLRLLDRWIARRRALPPALRKSFNDMWHEANQRWRSGITTPTAPPLALPVRDSGYEVFIRPGTSDVLLYEEVVIQERYGRIPQHDIRTIIDCGANIGLTSAYMLARWPHARVIALEPDATNFDLCVRNLAQFADRAVVLRAALWGRPIRMTVDRTSSTGTWASTVIPFDDASGESNDVLEGVDLLSLLDRLECGVIDLLKIDIEGAEAEVFAAEDLSWLDRVRCIEIELENDRSRLLFHRALSGRPFSLSRTGDVTIAVRRDV